LIWPEDAASPVRLQTPGQLQAVESIETGIHELAPKNEVQRWVQARALQLANEIMGARWQALALAENAPSAAFFTVVVCWLTGLFISFGLFAPRNSTVMLVLGFSAASVASALYLILELGTPYDGIIKLSGAPLRIALSQLGQ
jgi:hypothetical protein